MKAYLGALLILVALIASPAYAAVIHGTVYDLDLNAVSQAVVEINTVPNQVMVAKNGTYSFNVPQGNFVISANLSKLGLSASEEITVKQDGDYVLDLILFPDISEEESLMNESLDVVVYEEPSAPQYWMWAIPVLVLLAVVAAVYWKKHRKGPSGEHKQSAAKAKPDLAEIIAFIKKEGGRTTQKELRKAIPYSEAKISLMIAELESQGKIKKIKKGRGNIIILE